MYLQRVVTTHGFGDLGSFTARDLFSLPGQLQGMGGTRAARGSNIPQPSTTSYLAGIKGAQKGRPPGGRT